jgi:hypothetical protein
VARAFAACVDRRHAVPEARLALGQGAVDLRVGPAGLGLDLGVGAAGGLQHQRARLGGLERRQRREGAVGVLPLGGALRGAGEVGRLARVELGVGGAQEPQPSRADGHRLVLDDCAPLNQHMGPACPITFNDGGQALHAPGPGKAPGPRGLQNRQRRGSPALGRFDSFAAPLQGSPLSSIAAPAIPAAEVAALEPFVQPPQVSWASPSSPPTG